ncbi:hypothetical protein [Gloeothece verrucosa]|uniref:Uncharacterized protein n=1 Tax=Gloeothece verrucosa (strain PCC 7822) TaxID=497965 RepID=E0UNT1_GLOV7|nr:hypothetical protein [Gloeothece verrucosa]ADN18611.1 hypothetical protein Cyan7822_6973 [Gloeothece verrucosa PCC 7822]
MTVTPVSESHVGQMQSALIAFAQTFLKMEGLKLDEKNQEKKPENHDEPPKKENSSQKSQKDSENTPFPSPDERGNSQGHEEKLQESNLIPLIEIWQNGNLIKGKNVDKLDAVLNIRLEMAHQLAQPGQIIKGLENLEVLGILGQKSTTLFKTDEQGKVEVNQNFSTLLEETRKPAFSKAKEDRPQQNLNSAPDIITQLINDYEAFRTDIKADIKNEIHSSFKEMLKERNQKPRDYQWWQKAAQRPGALWDLWRTRRSQQSAAYTITQLWQSEAAPNDKLYQANGYSVYREGNEFKLEDNQGNELLRFKTNSLGAAMVTQSHLKDKDLDALKDLKQSLKSGQLTEDFMTVDKLATSREIRTLNIVEQLVSLSKQTSAKSRQESDENNRYLIRSASNGEVVILKKDELNQHKIIFQRTAQGVVNLMTKQDLEHLENVLKIKTQSAIELNRQIEQVRNTSTVRRRGP